MAGERKYLYGPVPSRRLGLSLGVDIVHLKVCTLDCIYCQLGVNSEKTIKRGNYAPIGDVLAELKGRVAEGLRADYITICGSGEPTLHSQLGELIEHIEEPIIIDHHARTGYWEGISGIYYCDDSKTSCAEIIFQVLKVANKNLDKTIGLALMAAIITDTGRFKFANFETFKTFMVFEFIS